MPIANYLLIRQVAGVLFLLDALLFMPWAQVAIGPGYFRGGAARARLVPWMLAVWVGASVSLIIGFYPLIGAVALLILFRHLFIHNRWANLFRGGGAPGFMSHWVTMYFVLFELAAVLDASGGLSGHVLTMLRIDFGVILMCSGTYKSLSGYLSSEGMEYGLANPLWGYFWKYARLIPPGSLFVRLQDTAAAVTQLVMGFCMLFEPTRAIGALLCTFGFLGLMLVVRLGRLAVLMALIPFFCLPDLGVVLVRWPGATITPFATPDSVLAVMHGLITTYLVLLPFVKAMQYLNLFGKVQLPGPIQRGLTWYANAVPIIMWRVFTPDVTNFFIRIYRVDEVSGRETMLVHDDTTYSYRELAKWRWSARFLHVTESIAITTVFTTLKYFRSQRPLFESRLLEYAVTLGEPAGRGRFRFQYVSIMKADRRFEAVPVANFHVDVARQTVDEEALVPGYEYANPAPYSHIQETTGFGSYLPKTATVRPPT